MASVGPVRGSRPLQMRVERRDGAAIVWLEGSASMEVSRQITHCLVGLATERVPVIVLQLSGLDFIDSVGLGGFVAAHLKGRHQRGEVRIVAPQPAIREMLELTRLTKLFRIYETVEEALGSPRP